MRESVEEEEKEDCEELVRDFGWEKGAEEEAGEEAEVDENQPFRRSGWLSWGPLGEKLAGSWRRRACSRGTGRGRRTVQK